MRKLIILVGAGLILVIGIIIALSTYGNHRSKIQVEKTSQAFMQDILVGDSSTSYSLFTSEGQQSISSDDWQSTVAQISTVFQGEKPTLTSSTASSGTYTRVYDVNGSDGIYTWHIMLQKEKGKWLVQSFNSVRTV